ncbi:hypothetical protein FXN65_06165 [Metapseudomonas lalkuanensis]|uniref:DUF3077 domain-containing protein n=2 Tax=Metapseudomonas lalkuanensis TaxID=2604832 RepID=A0A5J6QTH7_9GAMM|nr:hypothetical protein [Pseudomonas lalkuanensis]QEY65724.1 hypothetical protein FXN65_06165 [Pseudomonas lalkuanensis]UCP00889.1 hypothetical protein LF844_06330 [Pseudomonas lalkuanensis]
MQTTLGLSPLRKSPNIDFTPLPPSSQPYRDVLFVNARAPSAHLFEAANQRMTALADLLRILESGSGGALAQETARLASALGLLLADAQALHEAAYLRSCEEERTASCQRAPDAISPSEAPA